MSDNTFYVDGRWPLMGYMVERHKCKRKILVETILIGTNHNMSVSATCAECATPSPEFQNDHPDIIQKIEEWKLSK